MALAMNSESMQVLATSLQQTLSPETQVRKQGTLNIQHPMLCLNIF